MKHIILDEHSWFCLCHKDKAKDKKEWFSHHCGLNPERFLFFFDNDFHIITYFKCMDHGNHIDYKESFLSIIMEQSKKRELYEIIRGIDVEKSLKENRLTGLEFDMHVDEVNYVYSNAAGRRYAISTRVPLLDKLTINDTIDKNYLLAVDFIKNDEFLKRQIFLYGEMEYLRNINKIHISDAEIVKSTAHLAKIFKKKIKEKSKQLLTNAN